MSLFHTYVNTTLSVVQEGETLGTFEQSSALWDIAELWTEKYLRDVHSGKFDVGSHIFSTYIALYVGELISYLNFYTGSTKTSSYIELKVNIIHNYQ